MLTNSDIAALQALRHDLHRFPEVSGQEVETAARIARALGPLGCDLVTGLGGHGVAAVFAGAAPGPTVMFRAELDALPITELSESSYRSVIPGKGHLCGHDGHMTILVALARLLARTPPARGRVVLMFQPAEEDGSGAAAVIADPRFEALRPDWAFSLHNMPGCALGECWLADGTISCASVGMKIMLTGKTSHASQPERGTSPGGAVVRLIPALGAMGPGGALGDGYRLVTVTHAQLGEPTFGITPGYAELWVTLRTMNDAPMAALRAEVSEMAARVARDEGLEVAFSFHDDFAASVNDADAVAHMAQALDGLEIAHSRGDLPMRPSEDFGRFMGYEGTKGSMVFLGSGRDHPALHNPDYDFPDSLIPIGARIFERLIRQVCG